MEEKAVRGVPWTLLGLALNKGLALLTTLVLARLVAPADFGLVAIGLIAINFLFWFGGISFGATLVVHQELDRRGQGTVLTLALGAAGGATAVAAGVAPLAARLLHQPRLTGVLLGLSAAVLIGGFVSFYESLLQSELEFRRRFAALTTQTVSFAVIAIALAAAGAGVWSLVAGQVGSNLLFALALIALAPFRVAPRFDPAVARTVLRTGRGFVTQGVTVFVRQNIDTVIVGRAFGSAAVGFYSMAFRLGDLTYSALADPIARVTFPAFARSRARDDDVRPAFLAVVRLVALVTLPVGVVLSAASGPFTHTVFGSRWDPMVAPLAVIGLWAAIRPVEATLSWLLNSLGRAGAVGWVSLIVLGPLVAGLVLAVSTDSLAIVACVPLADTVLSFAILTVLVRRHADVAPAELWEALRAIVAASVPVWGVTRLVAATLDGHAPLLALGAAVTAGLVVYLAAIALLDRTLLRWAVERVRRVFGRGLPDVVAS